MRSMSLKEAMEAQAKMCSAEVTELENQLQAINKRIDTSTDVEEIVKLKLEKDNLALGYLLKKF